MSDLVGLIPAHAGKTSCRSPGWPESAAHPRSRGENVFKVFEEGLHTGSSPLTRGKPQARRRDRRRRRLIPPLTRGKHTIRMSRRLHAGLIPAHAGKTSFILGVLISDWAHPRSRGENHRCVHLRTVASGSSPLTRGKPRANASMSARVGLIPAHAGKTGRRRGRSQQLSAHPRSRGENFNRVQGRRSCRGSSPLTRGKLPTLSNSSRQRRLIPAHAGKTVELVPVVPGRTAHPRSRGENRTLSLMICISVGSSPLTRGKLPDRGSDRKAGRLIPAHAGKTTRPTSSRTRCPAHPRSRGENGAKMKRALSKVGSSPLTRGKLVDALVALAVGGLIPAHAGKTS